MKVLIADDNAFYARMLGHAVREWGYEVVACADGNAAWEALQGESPPRLAVLDWMMPGVDGPELCRRLRARGGAEPTYVILLTAKDGKENLVAGLQAGADDYISKPFNREELRARLQVGLRIVELQASLAARVKELEHALSVAQRLEVMGQLAGGVAHDFNNLLTVVHGGCQLLLAHPGQPAKDRELLALVREAGERGTSLTRQLLAFSSRQVLAPRVLELNTLIAGLQKLLRRLIHEHITLRTDLDPAAGCVRADPGQLEQVLLNLVVNARDAMPAGGELVLESRAVELTAPLPGVPGPVGPGSYVLLRVRDTGCGMEESVKARVFEPFFTTKEPGKGTGLGLATVYGVVKQSGGSIRVDSRPGAGTTFSIYLPRSREGAAPTPPLPSPPRPRAEQTDKETVLLVEDEEHVRAIAGHVLRAHQYTVLEAADGCEALRVAAEWPRPIHLLLTDVVMPHCGGRQLAESLRPLRPAMKVLFMSGYTDDGPVPLGGGREGTAFLQKPFGPDTLVRRVRELLET